MNPSPEYRTSAEALAAVLAPGTIQSPLGMKGRKAVRILLILLGLFVLGCVVLRSFGQKVERKFEEQQTIDPWGNRNPWGRR